MDIEKLNPLQSTRDEAQATCFKKHSKKEPVDLYAIVSEKSKEYTFSAAFSSNNEIALESLTKALKALVKESSPSLDPTIQQDAKKLLDLLEDDEGQAIFLDYASMEGDTNGISRTEFDRLLQEQVRLQAGNKNIIRNKGKKKKITPSTLPTATRVPFHTIIKGQNMQDKKERDYIMGNILIDANINDVVKVVKDPQKAFGKGVILTSKPLGKHESSKLGFDEVYTIQNKPVKLGVGFVKMTVIDDCTENIGVNIKKAKECTSVHFESLPDSKHKIQGEWVLTQVGPHQTSAQLRLHVDLKNNLVSDGKILSHINKDIGNGLRGARNTAENNNTQSTFPMFAIFRKLKNKMTSWRNDS